MLNKSLIFLILSIVNLLGRGALLIDLLIIFYQVAITKNDALILHNLAEAIILGILYFILEENNKAK